MFRFLKATLALLGLAALLAVAAFAYLLSKGELTPDKVANFLKFNPAVSGVVPVESEEFVQTSFARLKARKLSLPALQSDFDNGGGAIAEVPGGIMVANRNGAFFLFEDAVGSPKLTRLSKQIDVNQIGFEAAATAQGYAIRPGTNVGYAGLGMRLHDLLLTTDGKQILASHTFWDDATNCATLRVVIADFKIQNAVPEFGAWRQVFESKPCLGLSGYKPKPFAGHQAGGRMVDRGNGKILLTIGDFKNDGVKRDVSVSDANVDYGKIHEIDLATATSRVFSVGHRNPQGLMIADDGNIWSTEHGPVGGDEINLIVEGTDYGWPKVTLGQDCHGCDWQIEGRHDGYATPAFSFVPSIGISNIVQSKGFVANWEGDLLVASMVGQSLHHLRLDGQRVVYDEVIPLGDRLRDMIRLSDGRVVSWTNSGQLVFLEVDEKKSEVETLVSSLSTGAQSVYTECKACHNFEKGYAQQGKISLFGVMGRARGSLDVPTYSDAMKAVGGQWNATNLEAYLANPQAAVAGTTMAFEGVADAAVRKELVDFLGKLQ